MGPGFDRKLGILAALSALVCAAAVGTLAYWSADHALQNTLRTQARSSATQIAQRAAEELKSVADRSRYYVSTSQNKSFESDGELLALSVLGKPQDPSSESADWTPQLRWVLPAGTPGRLAAEDFVEIDLKHPVDFDRIAQGLTDVIFASSRSAPAFLRLAIPYGEKSADGFTQALVTEFKIRKFHSLFSHREGLFAFMTAARGQYVIGSDDGRFTPLDDLSQLPILQAAHDSPDSQGTLDYREKRLESTQYAAFARVSSTPGLTIVAQASRTRITAALEPLVQGLTAAGLAFALILGSLAWWFSARWSWELQVPSRAPASADASPSAFSKISDPDIRKAMQEGGIKLGGQRIEAAVLHSHLHGVDRLSEQADPERLLKHLNEFHQSAVQAVESRHGVVDHMHGGSVVAFWGVPRPQADDVAHAIEAAASISEAAHRLGLALKKEGLPACRLAMGLHYGPIAVGQVGTQGRLEYSAVGEALETAARIQQFTEQFGTDFLMTGAAAKRTGDAFATEQLTEGDDGTPELYELAGDEEAEDAA